MKAIKGIIVTVLFLVFLTSLVWGVHRLCGIAYVDVFYIAIGLMIVNAIHSIKIR